MEETKKQEPQPLKKSIMFDEETQKDMVTKLFGNFLQDIVETYGLLPTAIDYDLRRAEGQLKINWLKLSDEETAVFRTHPVTSSPVE